MDAPTRVRVLTGEDADNERRGDKKPLFRSECTYYCPDEATARRCIEALAESDKRLRERPEELMLWTGSPRTSRPSRATPTAAAR
ncbi:hypothetical protein ACFWVC_14165 [Streptomyces sp. NPDC058691]|uniref:hypothetical protein n=1 Tax=Streptomyces sp. NPDC058691 TaxID=3346601 RepID=UPI003661272D